MNELFERLLHCTLKHKKNTIWNGLCVCEYDGLIHGWAYIRVGLYLECCAVSVSNMVGLCTGGGYIQGGLYSGGGLIVGGLR